MPKRQPDAKEFAKVVLHHLCNLRAEISTLKAQIEDLQKASGHIPPSKTVQELESRESFYYKESYRQACGFVKLPPTLPGTPDDLDL